MVVLSNPQFQSVRICVIRVQTCSPAMKRLLLLSLVLPACVQGPNYERPTLANLFSNKWKHAEPSMKGQPLPDEWWKVFGSSTLNGLVSKALSSNLDLAGAKARVETSRALIGVKRSEWFPQLNSTSSIGTQRLSQSGFARTSAAFGPVSDMLLRDSYKSALDMSYELDLWGRVKRSVESAEANAALLTNPRSPTASSLPPKSRGTTSSCVRWTRRSSLERNHRPPRRSPEAPEIKVRRRHGERDGRHPCPAPSTSWPRPTSPPSSASAAAPSTPSPSSVASPVRLHRRIRSLPRRSAFVPSGHALHPPSVPPRHPCRRSPAPGASADIGVAKPRSTPRSSSLAAPDWRA